MSPKIKSLGTNKGHASTRKYCTETNHETEISKYLGIYSLPQTLLF